MQSPSANPSFAQTVGVRPVEASADRVVAEMDWRADLQQGTGVFHAGAIMALAHRAAADCAALNAPAGGAAPRLVQLTSSLYRNVGEGNTIRADARPAQRGRTLIVIETAINDAAARLLGTITTTYVLAPAAASE